MDTERTQSCFIGRPCQLLRLFSVIVRRVGMEHGWNVSVRGYVTNFEMNQSQGQSVHHKPHTDWPRTEVGPAV